MQNEDKTTPLEPSELNSETSTETSTGASSPVTPAPAQAAPSATKTAQTKTASPAADRAAAKPKTRVGSVLFSILLLAGLAGLGFYTWEQHKAIEVLFGQNNETIQQRANIDAQLEAQDSSRQQLLQTVQQELEASQAAVAAQKTRLDDLNRELINTRLRINDSGAGASQAWMLTEAESLLRFAQQRLLLGHDVRSAIGLFVASDDLLKQINDPAVFSVREALALDLGALQAVREADVPGLYARLGAVVTGLDALQVQPAGERPAFKVDEAAVTANDKAESGWWESARAGLAQYFVITREANEAIPQLNAEQTWVLKETLRLKLEQARVALVRAQPELYQAAISEAIAGIDTLMQGANKTALLAELESLRAAPIVTVVPAVNLGLTALRQLQPGILSSPEVSP